MLALTIAAYAIGTILLGCGGAILLSMQLARRSAAPFFPSTKAIARLACAAANLRPGERFYDIGAGTGTAVIVADQEFHARATGFEISILPYVLAKLKVLLSRSHAKIVFKDLFVQPLGDADVVFLFLAERVFPRVMEKFRKELRPGARIISYAFPLPGMEPYKVVEPRPGAWKIFCYRT